jgi:hypothetical protein
MRVDLKIQTFSCSCVQAKGNFWILFYKPGTQTGKQLSVDIDPFFNVPFPRVHDKHMLVPSKGEKKSNGQGMHTLPFEKVPFGQSSHPAEAFSFTSCSFGSNPASHFKQAEDES